jgi:hypothetical protein
VRADRLLSFLADPGLIARALVKRSRRATFEDKLAWDAVDRPHYAYCTYQAALQARALGMRAISVMELGVAGGNGLIALESIADIVGRAVGIDISVFGFDAGSGMPEPVDHRDLPYVWQPGFFSMDHQALLRRLRTAELVIGDVATTVPAFVHEGRFPPIGFVAFDLDYYSSTVAGFALLEGPASQRLPRTFCYFDDIVGDDWELHGPHAGELLAISEFNAGHQLVKIDPVHGLRHKRHLPAAWNDQIFVVHDFSHPLYNRHVHPSDWDLRLTGGPPPT